MKIIGLNTLFLIPNQVGGTEYYTRAFIDTLQKLDKSNRYVLFCNQENAETFDIKNPLWKKVICPVSASNRFLRIFYEQLFLPFLLIQEKISVLHSFGYFGPIVKLGWKHLVTIHDTNWKDHADDVSFLQKIVLSFLIEGNIITANHFITDSDFGKSRLIHHFPQLKRKILVIMPGINEAFKPSKKGKEKYLMCVSAFYPHKNIPYVIKLWKVFLQLRSDYTLLLIGKNGADYSEVMELLRTTKNVEHYTKVPFDVLIEKYQQTSLAIFPSVYEGFGYPVYEAYACGAKVIVGKKELYHSELQPALEELTFNIQKDVKILEKSLVSSEEFQTLHLPTQKQATLELLSLYNQR